MAENNTQKRGFADLGKEDQNDSKQGQNQENENKNESDR